MKWLPKVNLRGNAWLAIFAFLMQALLPAAIYASTPANSHLSEICTTFGIKKIAVPDRSAPDSLSIDQHCPVCSVAQFFALPTPESTPDFHRQPASPLPVLSADRPAFVHIRLLPFLRGPPTSRLI